MFNNISLIGTITTVDPFTVSVPGRSGLPLDSKRNPYIPASTLRGALRHAMHNGLTQLKAENKQFFTVDQHYMIASGVDTSRTVTDDASVGGVLAIRKENPVISVFGRWKLGGKLSVGNAVASREDIVVLGRGARAHLFNREPQMSKFVDKKELDYLAEILAADSDTSDATKDLKNEETKLKRERNSADKDRKAEIAERLNEISAQLREIKDARAGSSESIQRPLEGFEAIDANVEMPHRLILANPSDDEFNTLLFSLLMFSKDNAIGGHRNLGCGRINCKWSIVKGGLHDRPTDVGEVTINEDGFHVTYEGKEITDDAIIDFAKKLSVSEGITKF